MNWIYYALAGAAILHVLEEYVYPGGFPDFMRKMAPSFALYVTTRFAVVINGLFLLLCIAAALAGQRAPVFALSIASLCGLNGLTHVLETIRARLYAPGVLTGGLLYLPLAFLAYSLSIRSGEISAWQGVGSFCLGLGYQVVPVSVLGLARALKHP
jgi:hypothetical protein